MDNINVLFVCLGNICRSPLAEGIFRREVTARGLADRFGIDSCGTSGYHIGEQPDARTRSNARNNGLVLGHLARQFTRQDFTKYHYILPMDKDNYTHVLRLRPDDTGAKVILMRDFDPLGKGEDVPDPYYGGERGFQEVYDILDRSAKALLDYLIKTYRLT